jgi:hypothetical protein
MDKVAEEQKIKNFLANIEKKKGNLFDYLPFNTTNTDKFLLDIEDKKSWLWNLSATDFFKTDENNRTFVEILSEIGTPNSIEEIIIRGLLLTQTLTIPGLIEYGYSTIKPNSTFDKSKANENEIIEYQITQFLNKAYLQQTREDINIFIKKIKDNNFDNDLLLQQTIVDYLLPFQQILLNGSISQTIGLMAIFHIEDIQGSILQNKFLLHEFSKNKDFFDFCYEDIQQTCFQLSTRTMLSASENFILEHAPTKDNLLKNIYSYYILMNSIEPLLSDFLLHDKISSRYNILETQLNTITNETEPKTKKMKI